MSGAELKNLECKLLQKLQHHLATKHLYSYKTETKSSKCEGEYRLPVQPFPSPQHLTFECRQGDQGENWGHPSKNL